MQEKKVAVIMGSDSDWPVVEKAVRQLKELGIGVEVRVMSAHRTPEQAREFAVNARKNGFGAIIAAAGKAAHLAGALAANTTLPVIGIPVKSSTLDGLDALLSTVQMPSGIPVATVAIDGAQNAALLAAEILAAADDELAAKLDKMREDMCAATLAKDAALQDKLNSKFQTEGIEMEKREQMYEGKAKKVYATDDPTLCIVSYKDDATAFNGEKRGTIMGKGVINNRLTNRLMRLLMENGIPTHFVEELSERDTLVKRVSIVPLEVIIRNISAGSFAKRYGVEEGIVFEQPTIEFSYKNDELGDPLMNSYHALALKLATQEEIDTIKAYSFKINEVLKAFLLQHGIELVDFKLEFGKLADGTIVLADEISPDTCRFWDVETHEKLDKDRFRRDMGGVEDAYQEVMRRIIGE